MADKRNELDALIFQRMAVLVHMAQRLCLCLWEWYFGTHVTVDSERVHIDSWRYVNTKSTRIIRDQVP